jgi:hypothetical protein
MSKIEIVLLQTTPLCYDVIKNIMSFAYSDKERWTRNNFKAVMEELMSRRNRVSEWVDPCGKSMLFFINEIRYKKRWLIDEWVDGYQHEDYICHFHETVKGMKGRSRRTARSILEAVKKNIVYLA